MRSRQSVKQRKMQTVSEDPFFAFGFALPLTQCYGAFTLIEDTETDKKWVV